MSPLRTHPALPRLSRHSRRVCAGIILLASAGCCSALFVLAWHSSFPPPAIDPTAPPASVQGLRTSIVRHGRLTMRVTADSVALSHPRALGPFRIGFLRTVSARNVTVETWPAKADAASIPDDVGPAAALAAALPPALRTAIVQATAERVRLITHRSDTDVVEIEARSCEATARSELICRFGWMYDGQTQRTFDEALFDGASWVSTAKECGPMRARRRVGDWRP
jgi:hypothetical protein